MQRAKTVLSAEIVEVSVGGKPFTTYRFAGASDGPAPFVRPFLYPVHAADGIAVTSDQRITGGDHPHHSSIWISHGDVNGVDHWSFLQQPAPMQRTVQIKLNGDDSIDHDLAWDGRSGEAILRERRTLRFFAFDDDARGIDLTVRLTPAAGAVVLGDTKEAGLCSVRMAKSIALAPTLVNSEGGVGEAACWGKPARWCDESGLIEGRRYGIAILDHPSNPRHPTTWHVRTYGLMTANPFGQHDFNPGAPADGGAMTLPPGSTTIFRYRIVIHSGDASSAGIESKFRQMVQTWIP